MTESNGTSDNLPARQPALPEVADEVLEGEIVDEGSLVGALAARRQRMMEEGQIDDSALYAGSPMHYYCKYCGVQTAVLPEGWWRDPPATVCDDCKTLITLGEHDLQEPDFPYSNRRPNPSASRPAIGG